MLSYQIHFSVAPFSPLSGSYFLNLLWKSKIKLNTSSTCPCNSISKTIYKFPLSHCKPNWKVKVGLNFPFSALNGMEVSPWLFFLLLITITYVSIYNTSVHCQRCFRAVFVIKTTAIVNNVGSLHLKSFNSCLTCEVLFAW